MKVLSTATNGEDSNERGFVLKSADGRYRVTPLPTVGELHLQLLSTSRTIVLPGQLDEATIQVLTSHGVPRQFLKAHLKDTEYSWRGSRPQDVTAAYFWAMPQFVRCCGKCTTEDFEYITDCQRPVVMLNVSLWVAKQQGIPVLLVQQSITNCQQTEVQSDPTLEDELREKLPHAGPNISIQDYINQLAYERWVEYIGELTTESTSSDLIWKQCVQLSRTSIQRDILLRRGTRCISLMNTLGRISFGDWIAACAISKLDTYGSTFSYDISRGNISLLDMYHSQQLRSL
ncbi:uncharacterized protein TrAtP1_012649 [Trichoderma atroviride]|uniref:uncharacterized protein n=1 Tax=Hypocrea atroviridis TaxID=63577 RepID=UPI00332EBAFF|nr:hypothetical protein TrAtP1_012649 [Trichoderma atroviride]